MIEPPKDTPEYAHGMWAAALMAAVGMPEMLEQFKRDTGISWLWEPARSPIEMMIDGACGRDEKFAHAFGKWFNEKVWGSWEGQEEA